MYIIAEVAQAHDGSLGNAIAFINSTAAAGVSAVKFQMHIASEESTKNEKFRINCFPQDKNRYEYWERTSFTIKEWELISETCRMKNIDLIISPFSEKAVDICKKLDVKALKIGSGEFFNDQLLEKSAELNKKLILSTGMASWKDIDVLMNKYKVYTSNITLLHCVSKYPCKVEETGIENVEKLKRRYGVRAGLSDHSGDIDVALIASARKFEYYEAHVCWSRDMFGPDTSSSLTLAEFKRLVQFDSKVSKADNIVSKDILAKDLTATRQMFSKSLVAAKDLKAGDILKELDLAYKKPGGGISWSERGLLIDRVLQNSLEMDQQIKLSDVS